MENISQTVVKGDSAGGIKPVVPLKVVRSNLPEFKPGQMGEGDVTDKGQNQQPSKPLKVQPKVVETKPKGVITIRLYKNRPYKVDFEGTITGTDRDIAWRAMMKQYMIWKAKLAKQGGK